MFFKVLYKEEKLNLVPSGLKRTKVFHSMSILREANCFLSELTPRG